MTHHTDATHDMNAKSWVPGADGHPDFPVQNLPLGIFATDDGNVRGGVAIGDHILCLPASAELLSGDARKAAEAADAPQLNAVFVDELGEIFTVIGVGFRHCARVFLVGSSSDDGLIDRI